MTNFNMQYIMYRSDSSFSIFLKINSCHVLTPLSVKACRKVLKMFSYFFLLPVIMGLFQSKYITALWR